MTTCDLKRGSRIHLFKFIHHDSSLRQSRASSRSVPGTVTSLSSKRNLKVGTGKRRLEGHGWAGPRPRPRRLRCRPGHNRSHICKQRHCIDDSNIDSNIEQYSNLLKPITKKQYEQYFKSILLSILLAIQTAIQTAIQIAIQIAILNEYCFLLIYIAIYIS